MYVKQCNETSIVTRFRQQAKQYSDKIAICTEQCFWTYHQLNQASNSIAWVIQEHLTSKPGQIVLLMEHSEGMIASLLAVLSTNNLYVPLDGSYPEERLRYITQDCQATLILTDQSHLALAQRLASSENITVINIADIKLDQDKEFPILSGPESYAYLIYTSGTSGKPKGVLQNHRNVLHFSQVYSQALTIRAEDRLTLLASFCFDAAVMDIFAALLNGATLYPYSIKRETAAGLMAWLVKNNITIYHSTPTLFRHVFQNKSHQKDRLNLRLVVLGGEVALSKDWEIYAEHCPDSCLLINGYGPTESTVTTQYVMDKHSDIKTKTLPIGHAVAETEIFINSEQELIISSPFVALGYWNLPELSEQVFREQGYHTGDLGQLLSDGAVEYRGRKDEQVKISGFRVEPNEITAQLLTHPEIKQVICFSMPNAQGDLYLAAFFTANQELSHRELLNQLKLFLPDYMLPAVLTQVDEIPMTTNGKVDRVALKLQKTLNTSSQWNETEYQLAALCESILPVRPSCAQDNIFELGCNSLLAMQLAGRISEHYHIEFSIKHLFFSPTIAGLAEIISRLQDKNQLPQLSPAPTYRGLSAVSSSDATFLDAADKPRHVGIYPASYAQKQFFFLSKLNNTSDFSITIRVDLSGSLNAHLFQDAFRMLIERHEILRTTLSYVNERVEQIIHDKPLAPLELTDLLHIPQESCEASINAMALQEANTPFNPLKGPLIRGTLVRCDANFQVFLLSCSHIIMDGWALNLLSQELSIIYNSLLNQASHILPPVAFQYVDYSTWQNQLFEDNVLEYQRQYWMQQLSNLPPPLIFPANSSVDNKSAHARFALTQESLTRLETFSEQHQSTLFMTLLSVFQMLLSHYTAQDDIIVGTPIANRYIPNTESIMGCLINVLALRGKLYPEMAFTDFLQQIKEVTLGAYDNQALPFMKIVESLGLARHADTNPLYQAMLVLDNYDKYDFALQDVTSTVKELSQENAHLDVVLGFEIQNKMLCGTLHYKMNVFTEQEAHHFVSQFEQLLLDCITHPQEPIGSLLPVKEYPLERTLVELFTEQVDKTPEQVAVCFANQQLSYRELNEKANQVAHYLIQQGVVPGAIVAVCLERSLELMISLLGIIKAGAAYLPLDVEFPAERLHVIVDEAKPFFLVTSTAFNTRFAIPSLCMDMMPAELLSMPKHNPGIHASKMDLLYVMYTSGSTGRPKGVALVQQGVLNNLWWMQTTFNLTTMDAVLQKTPYTADTSVWEIFWPLLFGARVVLAIHDGHKDSIYLRKTIIENNITVANFVPSMLRLFLKEQSIGYGSNSLRVMICCGEEVTTDLQKSFFEQFKSPSVRLCNIYGPTEASIGITAWHCRRDDSLGYVPIGYPIANAQLYILDHALRPVPVGTDGMLYIGGISLALGYLHRPELTAERFIPNPFSVDKNDKLYHTGDVCRWAEEGHIEFLGRADFQIKLRGHRIEIGEIESKLRLHPAIDDCVIVAQEDKLGQQKLVAYFIPHSGDLPVPQELHQFLSQSLPHYMLPSAWIILPHFPLSANGKLDRKALPLPEEYQFMASSERIEPRTATEKRLSQIWCDVLNISTIGIHDDFFYLGGHSLLITQVISRIRQEFQIQISLRQFYLQPTIAAWAQLIEMQKPGLSLPVISPVSRDQYIPLSYAQHHVWLVDQVEHSAFYNIPQAWQLEGPLHYASLKVALHYLIERHETLRTTFEVHEHQPYQRIADALAVDLPYLDMSALMPTEQGLQLKAFYQAEAFHVFDLTQGPLFKVSLLKLEDDRHLLFLNIHHIIADGWSLGVFLEELMTCYLSVSRAQLPTLPPLPIQYVDYTYWQLQMQKEQRFEPHVQFWETHLKDAPPVLKLPTARPRPARPDYKGGQYRFMLPRELHEKAQSFSQQHQLTLFVTLLTAFYVLLYRYTAEEDMVVGIDVANRDAIETQGLIGYFSKMMALRQQVSADDDFLSFLRTVNERFLQAQDYNALPMDLLIEHLKIERSLNYAPLFQVVFNFLNFPQSNLLQDSKLKVSEYFLEREESLSKLDMSWFLIPRAEGLEVTIEYAKALFEESSIERMANHWQIILSAVLAAPETKISAVSLLTAYEQQQLLAWNATEQDFPLDCTIAELFAEQVEKNPDQIAVCFTNQRLSYRELNEKANQVAHYLIQQGVTPNSVVAICLERSLELIISLLGIIKARAAYLPLDIEFPAERIHAIVDEVKPRFLITTTVFNKLFFNIPNVLMDEACVELWNAPKHNPNIGATKTDLMYVMYTSGSTGRPKGAMIMQQGILNRLWWMQTTLNITSRDKVLQKTPYTTDTSVWEIFWPLLFGAQLVVAIPNGHRDSAYLCKAVIENDITIVDFLPSMLRLFLEEQSIDHGNTSLRLVVSGGDELTLDLQQLFFERFKSPAVDLYNTYGPTETSIGVCAWRCRREDTLGYVPLGQPIANTQLHILDSTLQPVPIGVPGTLYIAGVSLGLGYLNRPELTAERFIPNPFSADKNEKMYHTGDVCRWAEEGHIEFLGRADFQIKLLGHRIEVGEIESQLRQHPAIDSCVVVAQEDALKQKKLVAYFIPREGQSPQSQELHQFLSQSLPSYMLPSAWVSLSYFPLNANGKLDRKALPLPEDNQFMASASRIRPRTIHEERLSQIWCDVLNISTVGVHDNFFYLGGHSLLMMQVVSRIHKQFAIELPLRQFYLQPTIAELAEFITTQKPGLHLPELITVSRDLRLPLSYAQQRVWFANQLEANALYHMANAWQLEGPVDYLALKSALQQLISRHESLRTRFVIENYQPYQHVEPVLEIDLPYVDISRLDSLEQQDKLIAYYQEQVQPIFDLHAGPLLRVTLIKLSPTCHALFLTIHHIIADGWSMHVLLRDLAHYYECVLNNQAASLPLLPIQYADYAYSEQQNLTGDYLTEQLCFWQTHLKDAPSFLKFPTDYPRPVQLNHEGGLYSFKLSPQLQQQLTQFSQQRQVTLFITLLTAFYSLLYRYTGEEDMVLGTVMANRQRIETEDVIGYFANTLALRGKVSAETSFQALLDQVRSTFFLAQEHQDLPFEQLVTHLELERTTNYHPLFQILFVLQNTPVSNYHLGKASLATLPLPKTRRLAKFDMAWEVRESSQGIDLFIEYSKELFREETIAQLARHWEVLLQTLSATPELTIAACPLLSAEEHQRYALWNNTECEYPHEQLVHQLFEEQAQKYPHHIALEFKEQQLTYKDLNEQANQVAHYLINQGITAGSLVAVCLERSFDLVITIWGILKAGAAYLPLDTEAPHQRLGFILEDSQAALLITHPAFHQEQVPEFVLETQRTVIASQSKANPNLSYPSSQLMYVIYTSGSSGQPKGVLIEHRSAINLLTALQRKYPLQAGDAYLLKTSVHFDASVAELFGWFWDGGRLVILEPGQEKEVFGLCSFIHNKKITHAGFVPSLLQMWLQLNSNVEHLSSLKYVFVVGELISKHLANQILDLLPQSTQFINVYGPTEATVYATYYQISREERCATIPIGKPLANVKTYILDKFHHPVPVGVVGEIYIGGAGVGRHYLNRPELSLEKFIESPERLYKTGDLGRYLPDGNMEFLGRADFQVKIRGFRVELGEIEHYLLNHPEVQQAHLKVQQDAVGEKQLIAYFIPSTAHAPSSVVLRSYLQNYFPEYMIPVAFVPMSTFPLNPNGKLDHKAFSDVDLNQFALEQAYVAPRNDLELHVAQIWGDVLTVSKIGVFDNFFHLGGHSLLAVQIILRMHAELSIEIPLRQLFMKPTIAALVDSLNMQCHSLNLPIITRIARTPHLRLSSAQQRVWFLAQLEQNALYNISKTWQVEGPLHYSSLKAALHYLIERHETLRTTFGIQDNQPYQRVADSLVMDLPCLDLSALGASEQEMQLKAFYQANAFTLFDFTKGPLFKVSLFKLGADRHLLFLNIHHIIADGWSLGVFLEELITCYQSFVSAQRPTLPALPIQYVDYAYWQLQMKEAPHFASHFQFWEAHLKDAPAFLKLPTDHPRPSRPDYKGGQYHFVLSEELHKKVQRFSQQQQVTVFVTMLTAFYVLLYRYTSEEDMVVGVATANRDTTETQGLIGYLANSLALRQRISADYDFRSLVQAVHECFLQAQAHQELPIDSLIEQLKIERSLNYAPLFQVMFNFLNFSQSNVHQHTDLKISEYSLEKEARLSKLDMSWFLAPTTEGFKVTIEYAKALFTESSMVRMAEHWQTILNAALDVPETKISAVPLLSAYEQQQLITWNTTEKEYSLERSIAELFAEQVDKTPDQIAVCFANQQLSYRELNEKANQVAHYLIQKGVIPNSIVAICLERSLELIVCLLGIIKAGAAYLPLDMEFPVERIHSIMNEAKPDFLITTGAFNKYFFNQLAIPRLLLDEKNAELLMAPKHSPSIKILKTDLLYVMYTSGSTGRPKGVMIMQQGILNRLWWMQTTFNLTSMDTVLQKTPYTTDTSVWEIFWPLLFGAKVVVAIPNGHRDSTYLCKTIIENGITVADFVPSMLRLFLEEQHIEACASSLRVVISGGEELTADIPKLFFERFKSPLITLYNIYGPTEASIGICAWPCRREETLDYVPIGYPIANTQLYILDNALQPVPVGVPGTLYIGGICLGLGYLHRPELTAEHFIQNPFSADQNDKLYHTGDVCRWSEEGHIEFLGRADFQIKLRGHRIEAGEIESQLRLHPAIENCVVVAQEDELQQKKLTAYFIPLNEQSPTSQELHQFLSQSLPHYMLPSAWIALPEFPLNPNGKLDRKALPLPEDNQFIASPNSIGARTENEERLSRIWCEVLNIPSVGIYDNFFYLGGHSLLVMQVVTRVRQEFNIQLPLCNLFLQPTIATWAHLMDTHKRFSSEYSCG